MSNKVVEFFITPMEAHFEAVPKDGPRETIISDLEQYSPDDLMQAAEWLKRARQAQSTFPSPKECIKAIKAVVGGRRAQDVIRGSVITRENYGANAHAYAMAHGGRREEVSVPVIKRGTPMWDDWLAYFDFIEAKAIKQAMENRESWTVPAMFPRQFDPRFSVIANAA